MQSHTRRRPSNITMTPVTSWPRDLVTSSDAVPARQSDDETAPAPPRALESRSGEASDATVPRAPPLPPRPGHGLVRSLRSAGRGSSARLGWGQWRSIRLAGRGDRLGRGQWRSLRSAGRGARLGWVSGGHSGQQGGELGSAGVSVRSLGLGD